MMKNILFVLLLIVTVIIPLSSNAQCGVDIHIANDNSFSIDGEENNQSRQFISDLALALGGLGTSNTESRVSISTWASGSDFVLYDFPIEEQHYTTDLSPYAYTPRDVTGNTNVQPVSFDVPVTFADSVINLFHISSDSLTTSRFYGPGANDEVENYRLLLPPEICGNGMDDDMDGLTDCEDDDCYLAANSGDTDTDGDGIGNSCDIDDDNDGILDTDECPLPPLSSLGTADGTFESLSAVAGVDFPNSNVTGGGWQNGNGTCDTWKEPMSATAIYCRGMTASPAGGVWAGGLAGLDVNPGNYESFSTSITGLVIGNSYSITFYQANGGSSNFFVPSPIGSMGRWKVDFGAETQYSNYLPYLGVGNQVWEQVTLTFTATSTTQTLEFSTDNDTSTGRNVYMAIDEVVLYDGDISCDTDGDGIPNNLDLDSDGDGCADAYESGHGQSVQVDSTILGPYGNNGLTDAIETTADSDTINYTLEDNGSGTASYLDNATQGADCPCSDPTLMADNCDFDGDGINNGNDLDDDNDGILDAEECGLVQSLGAADGSFEALAGVASDDAKNGNVTGGGWVNGAGSADSWVSPMPVMGSGSADGWADGMPSSPDGGVFAGAYGNRDQFGNIASESFYTTLTGLVVDSVYRITMYQANAGIDSYTGFTFGGFTYNGTPVGSLGRWQVKIGASIVLYTEYLPYLGEGMQVWETVSFTFTAPSTSLNLEFVADALAPSTSNLPESYMAIDGVSIAAVTACTLDSDGDGIVNSLDLDSDGDGCPDVLEAGHADMDMDSLLGSSPVTVDGTGLVQGQGGYTGTTAAVTDNLDNSTCCGTDLSGASATGTNPTNCTSLDGSVTISGIVPADTIFNVYYLENGTQVGPVLLTVASGELTISSLDTATYSQFILIDTAYTACTDTLNTSVVLSTVCNTPPDITSDGGGMNNGTGTANISIAENTTSVTDVESTDTEDGVETNISYSLSGPDAALFMIDANGNLAFISAPDYENPGDQGTDNIYNVTVTVTDSGGLTDSQDIVISVTDDWNDDGIRLLCVDPTTDEVTIKNFGTNTKDISALRLCSSTSYTADLSSQTITMGSLILAPGDEVTLTTTTITLDDVMGDLGLYAPGGGFGDATAMLDFTQWGAGGQGRESVAVSKGIWTAGDYIDGPEPFCYSGTGTETGVTYWCPDAVIMTEPTAQSVCATDNAIFSLTTHDIGSQTPTYQWQENSGSGWNDLAGETSASLTLSSVTAAMNANQYRVQVSSGACSAVTSAEVALTVEGPLVINTEPTASTVCAGDNAMFSVVGDAGAGTLAYQWQENSGSGWNDLAGETSASLTLSSVTAAMNANQYRVQVSSAACSGITSAEVGLTVEGPLVINTEPTASTVCAGDNAMFSVVADAGAGTLAYQWQENSGSGWNDLAGETNASLTLSSVTAAMNANQYRVQVSSGACSAVTSAEVALAVEGPLVINTEPTASTVCAGDNAMFSVVGNAGAGTLAYQWQENSGSGWNDLAGETSASLTLSSVTAAMNTNQYRVQVSSGACSGITSAEVGLTVEGPIVVNTAPSSITICAGDIAIFSVAAAVGTGTLSYQWQENTGSGWNDLAGETSTNLILGASTASMNGNQYRVQISSGACSAMTSTEATLTVEGPLTINAGPLSTTVCETDNAVFSVVTDAGAGTAAYQWQENTGSGWNDLAGETGASLTLNSVTTSMNGNQYRVRMNSGACIAIVSAGATLTVEGPLVINTEPVAVVACAGDNATYSVVADAGVGTLVYQWQENSGSGWNDLAGETGTSLMLSSVTAAMNGNQYRVQVSSGACNAIVSAEVSLTVEGPLVINAGPLATTVCVNDDATLSVVTDAGAGTAAYQWQENSGSGWNDLVGETGISLILSSVTTSMNGNEYRVQVSSGACNAIVSSEVALTVEGPLVINTEPVAAVACAGDNATFNVVADAGAGTLAYQWQENTGSGWNDLAGETGTNLALNNVATSMNGNEYRVQVSSGACNAIISAEVSLTVEGPLVINTEPSATTICAGDDATFNVVADAGAGTLAYQWQENTGSSWNDLAGETNASLTLNNVVASMDGNQYRVQVSSGACIAIVSVGATLTVEGPIVINTEPVSAVACAGDNATFSVVADAGVGTLAYQWQENTGSGWNDLAGETNASLTLSSVTAAMTGNQYRVQVSSGACSAIVSAEVSLTVEGPLVISTGPSVITVCSGHDATFSVVADAGAGTLAYQWQENSGSGWNDLAGETNANLTLNSVNVSMNLNQYRVRISSSACIAIVSVGATLIVEDPLSINTEPSAATVCAGDNAMFSVVADAGSGTASYQWQENSGSGWNDLAGETNANLTLNSVTASMNGNQYRVQVSKGTCTTLTSAEVNLTVEGPVSITTEPVATTVCSGDNAMFSAVANAGAGTLAYQWQANSGSGWNDLAGETNASLNLSSVTAAMNGNQYRVQISSGACSAVTSAEVILTVEGPLVINTEPSAVVACEGDNAMFSVVGDVGVGTLAYQWQENSGSGWNDLAGETNASLTLSSVTTAMNGNQYRVEISSGACSVVTSAEVTLTVEGPISITTEPIASTVCAGDNAMFSVVGDVGVGTLAYQWQVNSGSGWNDLVGETNATLTLNSVTAAMNGNQYRVQISSGACSAVTSAEVILTVEGPLVINTEPSAVVACEGDNAMFSIVADAGVGTLAYQWQANSGSGWNDLAGETNASLTLSGVTVAMSGNQYRVQISSGACSALTSAEVSLTVNGSVGTATINGTTTIVVGNSTDLNVDITAGTGPYTVVYNDGTSDITVNNYNSGDAITVSPSITTTYNLVSVTDANACTANTLIGPAIITVQQLIEVTPVAINDINITNVDIPVSGNVLTNDRDPQNLPLTVTTVLISGPGQGMVALNVDGSYTYTPNAGVTGEDEFCYEISNTLGYMDTACAVIEIIPVSGYGNDSPVAVNDNAETVENVGIDINVLSNDIDPDGNNTLMNPVIISSPDSGTVAVNVDGTITYTPNAGFIGEDVFTYEVCDDGIPALCDTAEVRVLVNPDLPGNNPPIGVDDVAYTSINTAVMNNVGTNDYDTDGNTPLTYTLLDDVQSGVLSLSANGDYTYTPDQDYTGNDQFTYEVCDSGSPVLCDTATVVITVEEDRIRLDLKVLLQGAMWPPNAGTALMRDDLRQQDYIPLDQPYSIFLSPRFAHVNGGGSEQTTTEVLDANAGTEDAIVDWVFIELHDAADRRSVIRTFSALVQRDGDVVAPDGGALDVTGLPSSFYVAIKHRNHLGVMTANPVSPQNKLLTADYTQMPTSDLWNQNGYDGFEMYTLPDGRKALWGGNANADNKVKYDGGTNDRNQILYETITYDDGSGNENSGNALNYDFGFGYFQGDVNMNGKVKYDGSGNDRVIIQAVVIALYPLNISFLNNFNNMLEQIPLP